MASLYKKPVKITDPKTGQKVKTWSRKWWGRFTDENGQEKRVPLATDKNAAGTMLTELVRKVERIKVGLFDFYEVHRKQPLVKHLADFRTHLQAKGNTKDHTDLVIIRCRRILDGTEAVYSKDFDQNRVSQWLLTLRSDKEPKRLPPNRVEFTPVEVNKLLGISGQAVRDAIRRHGLEATGDGKARIYPRATVETLLALQSRGAGPETTNHHIRSIRAFLRWMVQTKRMPTNPLEGLQLLSVTTDRRHDRRELTSEEMAAVLEATRASQRVFRDLTGEDRYHIYALASGTGFRAGAIAGLTPDDFDLENGTPYITLPARLAKNRKVKVQPISAELAEVFKDYLRDRPSGIPIWAGSWAEDGAAMLRGDLADADIPYVVDGSDGPLFADFHSLRHSYITALGRAGVDLRTAQELAGHSSPVLTARYSHRRLHDLAGAVEKLPSILPTPGKAFPQHVETLKLTGTGG